MASAHVRQQSILSDKEREQFEGYDFPFENLVLEGGGAKLVGGVGTVRVLEELGVLKNMKRFGGTSAGSFLATLIALGYNGLEIEELMAVDMRKKIEDEWSLFRHTSRLVNLVTSYGIHYGASLKKWIGELVAEKMDGNPDATFWELYEKTGKELVVTATELMQKECVYFHVKTFPDRPIREAVFMSMSIPGFLRPSIDTDAVNDHQVYVDGGVIYNYPIHCFDGWFLSHGEENDFFKKHVELGDKDTQFGRFEGRNDKTIGLIVYSTGEDEFLRVPLEKRNQAYIENIPEAERTTLPDSKLRREHTNNNPIDHTDYQRRRDAQKRFEDAVKAEHVERNSGIADAVLNENKVAPLKDNLHELVRRLPEEGDGVAMKNVVAYLKDDLIDVLKDDRYKRAGEVSGRDMKIKVAHLKDELIDVLQEDHHFDDEDATLLYGLGVDAVTAVKTYMAKHDAQDETGGADKKVGCRGFERHMVVKSSTGLELIRHERISSQRYAPRRIGNVADFLFSIVDFYGNQMMRLNQKPEDYNRTIGVDVDYITTGDYNMEDEDRTFLLQQSKIACLAFLDEYINKPKLTRRPLTRKRKRANCSNTP